MEIKPLTIDLNNFADPESGVPAYIAESFKMLISTEDTEGIRSLIDSTVFVADALYDILEEIEGAMKEYEQIKNKMLALEKQKQDTENALRDLREKKVSRFGDVNENANKEEAESASLAPASPAVKPVTQDPDVTEDMKELMDSMLTVENVIAPPTDAQELLRESGIIFNAEIEEAQAAQYDEDINDYSDGYYNDIDMESVDIDNGYQPQEPDPLASYAPLSPEPHEMEQVDPLLPLDNDITDDGIPTEAFSVPLDSAERDAIDDMMDFFDESDEDFLNMFSDDVPGFPDDEGNEIAADNIQGTDTLDDFGDIGYDDLDDADDTDKADGDEEKEDEKNSAPSAPAIDDDVTSGFVDPDFL